LGEHEENKTILGDMVAECIGEIAFTIFAGVVGVFAYEPELGHVAR